MAHDTLAEGEEATRLLELFSGREVELIGFLSGQLSVLKSQAQMLMGLCGLTITVTGFSGHHMVRGGWASTTAMILGIMLILGAVAVTLRTMAKLRWVTQDLSDDMSATVRAVLERRNAEQRALGKAGALVGLGLGGYLVAVVLAAIHNGGLA